jgi:hypothetical protein
VPCEELAERDVRDRLGAGVSVRASMAGKLWFDNATASCSWQVVCSTKVVEDGVW